MKDPLKIRFQACDVRPNAQKDGGWNINFECGAEAATAVALLAQLRKELITVEVELAQP